MMAENRCDVAVQEHRRELGGVARHDPRMEQGRGTASGGSVSAGSACQDFLVGSNVAVRINSVSGAGGPGPEGWSSMRRCGAPSFRVTVRRDRTADSPRQAASPPRAEAPNHAKHKPAAAREFRYARHGSGLTIRPDVPTPIAARRRVPRGPHLWRSA
jgi:hypothetical protein